MIDQWVLSPSNNPNVFILKTKNGAVICELTFPETPPRNCLELIAAAPDLQDIAEMFYDHISGSAKKKGMIFEAVKQTLAATGSYYAEDF